MRAQIYNVLLYDTVFGSFLEPNTCQLQWLKVKLANDESFSLCIMYYVQIECSIALILGGIILEKVKF